MSHNVSMSGIPWKNMTILDRALKELNRDFGTGFVLKVGAVPSRNYGSNLNKVLPNTVAVISDPAMRYDISVQCDPKTKEYSVQAESLLIETLVKTFKLPSTLKDVSTGRDVNIAGVGYMRQEDLGLKAALGPITQRYALLVAEQQAALAGHSCRRTVDAKTGVISLVATVS